MGQHDNMVNIAIIGIIVTLLGMLFKKTREEFAILICIAGCFIIFSMGIPKLQIIFDAINKIVKDIFGKDAYLEPENRVVMIIAGAYLKETDNGNNVI